MVFDFKNIPADMSQLLFQHDREELRTTCQKVNLPLSEEDDRLMRILIKYVKWSQDPTLHHGFKPVPAIGIAANQIGVPKRMYYILFRDIKNPDHLVEHAIINGRIVYRSTKRSYLPKGEGCLSVLAEKKPRGLSLRHYSVQVIGVDYFTKKEVIINANNLEAIVLQHEQDHLEGKLFYDHINTAKPWEVGKNWVKVIR